MKIKSAIINNYRSFSEENNVLIFDDAISTIVGKNESGKSNLTNCLAGLKFFEVGNELFYNEKNNYAGENVSVMLELISEDSDGKYLVPNQVTEMFFCDTEKICVSGAYTDFLSTYEPFQSIKKEVVEYGARHREMFSGDMRNKYYRLIEKIDNAEVEMFTDESIFTNIIKELKASHSDFAENIENCIQILMGTRNLFPNVVLLDNESLKTSYKKTDVISGTGTNILNDLAVVLGIQYDQLKEWWGQTKASGQINTQNFIQNKIDRLMESFNDFYGQEPISMKINYNINSLDFAISSTEKYNDFDDRSDGLKWYLNTFIKLSSRTRFLENCVIVLDEPGVHLHINAQKQLLSFFEDLADKGIQIVYTTHSPYMIYQDKLHRIRLLYKDEYGSTHISNNYHTLPHKMNSYGDTIAPICDAIGMDLKHNIIGVETKENIIVEGESDKYYILGYFIQKGTKNVPNIISSVGAGNIRYLVTILFGWGCNVNVILDQDSNGRSEYRRLCSIIDKSKIVFIDGNEEPVSDARISIEELFSDEDKAAIGINEDGYSNKKRQYSLMIYKKVEEGEYRYSKETMENFNKVFENLL